VAAQQRGATGLLLAQANWASYIRRMESPKSVNAFLLTVVGIGLLGLLALSIYIRDFGFLFQAIGVLALVALGCLASSVLLGVITTPLVWLLSVFSGRPPKRRP
jgi:hypothetical protein